MRGLGSPRHPTSRPYGTGSDHSVALVYRRLETYWGLYAARRMRSKAFYERPWCPVRNPRGGGQANRVEGGSEAARPTGGRPNRARPFLWPARTAGTDALLGVAPSNGRNRAVEFDARGRDTDVGIMPDRAAAASWGRRAPTRTAASRRSPAL